MRLIAYVSQQSLNRSLLLLQEFTRQVDMNHPGSIENSLDILVKGVELALRFYESDLSYQQRVAKGKSSVNLEYAKFTKRFSYTMFDVINGIFNASAQYRLLYKTLEMVNWDLSRDPKAINYADMIVENYNTLNFLDEHPASSTNENIANIRKLNVLVGPLLRLSTGTLISKIGSDKKSKICSDEKLPCGLEGSVDERIKDCSCQLTSRKAGFVLVTRSKKFKEVYKELKTDLLWSDRLSNKMDHYDAQKACKSSLKEVAGITGKTWRLPSIDEYKEALKNGISEALPNMKYSFWSSSVHPSKSKDAWLVASFIGYAIVVDRYNYDSVRCVAR